MPKCTYCSGTSFNCLDGMYFCVECDTQSQDFIDEQASELLAGQSFTTKQLRKTKKRKVVDNGLPWNTAEGFQLIIKGHVQVLIELGINPMLDETMQQIWFQYVHKSGLAVMSKSMPTHCRRDVRFRDYFLEHFREDVLPVARKELLNVDIRLSKKSRAISKSDSELNKTDDTLEHDEEWFSVDTEPSSDGETQTDCSKSDSGISTAYKPQRWRRWHFIGTMTCAKIICFCHIALQWLKEPVTVGDLIHWIEIGRLPYYGAAECLLPHMKLSTYDHNLFARQPAPNYEQVVIMSEWLTQYLDIPNLPAVDVMRIVYRYLVQLNLPLAFMAYIRNLSHRVNLNRPRTEEQSSRQQKLTRAHACACYCPDLLAAGLIGVFLKLLFVLDDSTEWDTDSQSVRCDTHEKVDDYSSCLDFSWKNWLKYHLLHQEHVSQNKYTVFKSVDPTTVGDVHKCVEHYLTLLTRGTTVVKSGRKHLKELAETKSSAFRKIAEKQGSGDVKSKWTERRMSGAALYKLLGYGNQRDSRDFTKCCTRVCVQAMEARKGTGYIAYVEEGPYDSTSYHRSYRFLLDLLSEVTGASQKSVHDFIKSVEAQAVLPFVEAKNNRGFKSS